MTTGETTNTQPQVITLRRLMYCGDCVMLPRENFHRLLESARLSGLKAREAESRASFWCGRASRFQRYFGRMLWICAAQGMAVVILLIVAVGR